MRMTMLLPALLAAAGYCLHVQAGSLSLPQALQRTLQHDAGLQAFPYQLRSREAEQLQAALTPNPQLNIGLENVLGSNENRGFNGAELSLSLSQVIELGQKRERRITLAQWQSQLQRDQYELSRLDALASTTRHYLQLLRLQQLQKLAGRQIERDTTILNLANERSQAGNLQDADISRIRLRLQRSQLQLTALQRAITRQQYQLAARWNAEPDFGEVSGDISALPPLPELSELQTRLQQSPTVQRYLTQQRIAASRLQLAQANSRPDISVSGGVKYNAAVNDTSLMLGVSIPLQLQNPYLGQQQALSAQQQLQDKQQQLDMRQLHLLLQQHWLTLQQLRDETLMINNQLLPEARQLLQLSLSAYQQGQIDLLNLLSAEDEQIQAQKQLIESQSQFHLTLLQLEHLSGQPMTIAGARTLPAREY